MQSEAKNDENDDQGDDNDCGDSKQSPMEDPAEKAHFKQVTAAFFFYEVEAARDVARMERDFASMPPHHLSLLSFDYKQDRIQRLKACLRVN